MLMPQSQFKFNLIFFLLFLSVRGILVTFEFRHVAKILTWAMHIKVTETKFLAHFCKD